MKNFGDKVIWITGASSGIGEALCIQFASLGAKIILSSRNENELQRVAGLCKLDEKNHLILPFDLSDTSHLTPLMDIILSKFGKIDVLINNGGLSQRSVALTTDMKTVRQIMEVNFFSAVALTQAVLPHMIGNNNG
ncbi:MAG: SDR family NAD(P)-dependent oxidoreductase, partial [Bacteroidota bacterium]